MSTATLTPPNSLVLADSASANAAAPTTIDIAMCSWSRHRPGFMRAFYAPIAVADPVPVAAVAPPLVEILHRQVHLVATSPVGDTGLDAHAFPYLYHGAPSAAARLTNPGVRSGWIEDRRGTRIHVFGSGQPIAPQDLVGPRGTELLPVSAPAVGQLAIEIAHATDRPLVLSRDRTCVFLHRCPTRPGSWRLTLIDGVNPNGV